MMNNKTGKSTFLVVLITMVLTLLFCYVFFKGYLYVKILNNDFDSTLQEDIANGFDININNGLEIEYPTDNFKKLERVKSIIKNSYLREYDDEKLLDSSISGLLRGLDDPYAAYYIEKAFESFYTQTEGEYEGIGIYVSYDEEKHMPIIITPIVGSPAADAGILPGDYIEYVEDLDAMSVSYDELIDAIKGKIGTKVTIGLLRQKEDETYEEIELKVERQKIDVNPITVDVFENEIGYIKLTSFDEVSYDDFKKAYTNLVKYKKVKGLIVDLRNNPGGILQVCTQITDMLVPEGKIVYTIDKAGKEEAIYSDKKQIEIPLVVLVNEGSASASEVFSGAIKDYGVGKIIGTKTYGKGVVQTLKSLGDGTYIKLTTSEYFSPKGNKIDGVGVEPDIIVELPEEIDNYYNPSYEDDLQLQRAIGEIKKMM